MAAPSVRRQLVAYECEDGTCPFETWFQGLKPVAAAKAVTALMKLERGIGDVRPVGQGVGELRVQWGAGLRIYFGHDGAELVILLCAGSKRRQQADIGRAKRFWAAYRNRKGRETGKYR